MNYTELKRLAEAATQGDWTHLKHGVIKGGPAVQFTNGSSQQQIVMTTGAEWMRQGEQYANADFIAAANPAAVLALIAENDELRNAGSQLRTFFVDATEQCCKAERERDQLRAEVAGLRTGYEAYARVNAELKAENEALRNDAERYRWLRSRESAEDPEISVTRWTQLAPDRAVGEAPRLEVLDAAVDDAMGKGEQS
ncbi:hypothetical protein C4J88_2941 [Pseudomonas sp. R4-39-08]|uniref:ead/Ea22-like family protein n=1 Tax=Pseudomonas sp. R4-39-08 TaxID=1173288 RepID=UPI000F56D339|nr:ead/Ea22-like family protein [Pseudomonas sp. R4-39-08]AZF37721.1 hypothetical protein C4J88_2941 [Pseudomonas sp. R4-39-08]